MNLQYLKAMKAETCESSKHFRKRSHAGMPLVHEYITFILLNVKI